MSNESETVDDDNRPTEGGNVDEQNFAMEEDIGMIPENLNDIKRIDFYVNEVLMQLHLASEALREGDNRQALLIAFQAFEVIDDNKGVPPEFRPIVWIVLEQVLRVMGRSAIRSGPPLVCNPGI